MGVKWEQTRFKWSANLNVWSESVVCHKVSDDHQCLKRSSETVRVKRLAECYDSVSSDVSFEWDVAANANERAHRSAYHSVRTFPR